MEFNAQTIRELAPVLIAMFATLTALGSAYFTYKANARVTKVETVVQTAVVEGFAAKEQK